MSIDFTTRNRAQVIRSINKLFETQDYNVWINRPHDVYNALRRKYTNYTTVYTMLTTLIAIVRDTGNTELYNKYQPIVNALRPTYDKIREDHRATKKQIDTFVDWDTIKKTAQMIKIPDEDYNYPLQQYLMILLYTEIEPLRLDYAEMKIYEDGEKVPDDENVLIYSKDKTMKIIINDHKTAKSSGSLEIVIKRHENKNLYDALLATLLTPPPGESAREYLFYTKTYKPMDANEFSKFIRDTFYQYIRKPIGVNMIRHAYYEKYGLNDFSVSEARAVGLSTHDMKTGFTYKLRGIHEKD